MQVEHLNLLMVTSVPYKMVYCRPPGSNSDIVLQNKQRFLQLYFLVYKNHLKIVFILNNSVYVMKFKVFAKKFIIFLAFSFRAGEFFTLMVLINLIGLIRGVF